MSTLLPLSFYLFHEPYINRESFYRQKTFFNYTIFLGHHKDMSSKKYYIINKERI